MDISTKAIRVLQGIFILLATAAATPTGTELFGDYQPAAVVVLGAVVVALNEGGAAFVLLVKKEAFEILERGPVYAGSAFAKMVDDVEEAFEWEIPDEIEVSARKIVETGVAALGFFYRDHAGFGEVDATPEQVVKAGAKQLGLKVDIDDEGEVVTVKEISL